MNGCLTLVFDSVLYLEYSDFVPPRTPPLNHLQPPYNGGCDLEFDYRLIVTKLKDIAIFTHKMIVIRYIGVSVIRLRTGLI